MLNFSSLAGLEVAEKSLVMGWVGWGELQAASMSSHNPEYFELL